ncbi:MAG: T9SS C-terminal target domain-containing protein, partial [Calditrichaeota bacterium]
MTAGCLIFVTSNLPAQTHHPRIHPYLQTVLSQAADNDRIEVYLFMQDRLTLEDLQAATRGLKRKERRKVVTRMLKDFAASSQQQVRAFLESQQAAGAVDRLRPIWLINAIAFRATPAVIQQLAVGFPEIQMIFYDAHPDMNAVLDDNGISRRNLEEGRFFYPTENMINPGLPLINAPQVWAEGDSGQGVLVANIDTGTDWRHPDLANNIWNNLGEDADGDGHTLEFTGSSWTLDPGDLNGVDDDGNGYVDDLIGWDFDFNDNDPNDGGSHGTATSGIVAGDGTNGNQTGVAPRAKLMILKNNNATESQIWTAMQYAVDNGADITTSSLSWKWNFSPKPNYAGWRMATDMELAAGLFHTNSTGNQGNQSTPGCNNPYPVPYNISTPGNCPSAWLHPDQSTLMGGLSSVVGCGDVNASNDIIASSSGMGPAAWEPTHLICPNYPHTIPPNYWDYPWSRQGPVEPDSIGLLKPDVSAPGTNTTSTAPGGGYQSFGGTSGATPHVAGTAALLLSINPDLEPADLSRILQTTAVEKGAPGKDPRYGAGRIDAYQAYLLALAEAGAPLAPTNLVAYSDYRTPTSMLLTWNDPDHLANGDTLTPDAFSIMIARDGVLIDSVGGGAEAYTDTGLIDGQEYSYDIWARVDSTGKVSEAISASWIAGGSPIPSPPVSFSVAGNQQQVTISWTSPTTNIDGTPMDDYAGVNLYRNDSLMATFTRTGADTGIVDSDTYTNATPGFYSWYIKVVDNEVPPNESDPSPVLGTPLSLPLVDRFENPGQPNPGIWENTTTAVNGRADNPPSPPYALNLNGVPNGSEWIDLKPLDLTGMEGTGVRLIYWYQPQGSGNAPEEGDSLLVYFKNDLGHWVLVAAYPGTTVQPFVQEIIDIESAPNGGGTYFHGQFQVRFRSLGGASNIPNDDWFVDDVELNTPLGIDDLTPVPQTFAVSPNFPNPFNPSTTIRYQLPVSSEVRLEIYNVLGQRVRSLVRGRVKAGFYTAVWDGRNDAGEPVASGIYLLRFHAAAVHQSEQQFDLTRKMI